MVIEVLGDICCMYVRIVPWAHQDYGPRLFHYIVHLLLVGSMSPAVRPAALASLVALPHRPPPGRPASASPRARQLHRVAPTFSGPHPSGLFDPNLRQNVLRCDERSLVSKENRVIKDALTEMSSHLTLHEVALLPVRLRPLL